jgi:hypothetical protein
LVCSICNVRKEKRFCLAVHGRICPQCCGEQREVTLDCPSECPYLQQARQYEKPRELAEMPPDEVFPKISVPEQFLEEHEPLIGGLLQGLGRLSASNRGLKDRDLIRALASMAQSYQTLVASGLVYAEAMPNPVQQTIIETLQRLLQEFREVEHRHLGYVSLKDSDSLKAVVFLLRLAQLHTSGRPLSRAFLDFLSERFPATAGSPPSKDDAAGRILLP